MGKSSVAGTEPPGADPGRDRGPRKLLRRFTLLSIASLVTILLLVGAGMRYLLRDQMVSEVKASSVAVAEAIFAQERAVLLQTMPNGWPRIGVAPAELPGLDLRMRKYLSAFRMVKVKLYDADSRIIYSSDPSIIGLVDASNPRLERVLKRGDVDAQLVLKGKIPDLHGRELFNVDVVETYLPVRLEGEIVGSFETYVDVTPDYASSARAVRLGLAGLLIVLLAVFGALYIPMRQGALRLARTQDQLRNLAAVDALTGLYNRRHLSERIRAEYSKMERRRNRDDPENCVAIIMADVDHFKSINDEHGHAAGDEVLREVAIRLTGALRDHDVIGRYGGEEFMALLPGADLDAAKVVAERMRLRIAQSPFTVEGRDIGVTASFGVAHCAGAKEDSAATIGRADDGLYRAKDAGRNRVVAVA